MMLLIAEIKDGLSALDFGVAYRKHMADKHHEGHRNASICAWSLLAMALRKMGVSRLPEVAFLENGKPVFCEEKLHFSLTHSANLAAALLSWNNCAVDLEKIEVKVENALKARCMHPNEIVAGMNFFECWTKKECLGKLSGRGIGARPCETDLCAQNLPFVCKTVCDSRGERYCLSAVTDDGEAAELHWVEL